MDNRIFNVNGRGLEMLSQTLKLAFSQSGNKLAKCWRFIPEKGFVLFWTDAADAHMLPAPMDADALAPMIHKWMESTDAQQMKCEGWDANADHDGDNNPGWRVYVENWGHVADHWQAICAVRPVYLWYGK
jgi:hypothetical protein